MKKRIIVFLALLLAMSLVVGAAPRLALFQDAYSRLTFTGTTAKCKVTAICSSDVESITAKVTLYYEASNGRLYQSATWPEETVYDNTYSFLEYAYNRNTSYTYVLEAVLTATDSDGNEETTTVSDEY